jgi:hypothetical protein
MFLLRLLGSLPCLAAGLLLLTAASLGAVEPERTTGWYQTAWCREHKGEEKAPLKDAECDCLTPTHAVTFAPAEAWSATIGRSLQIAALAGKKPGIVLVLEALGDEKHYDRLHDLVRLYKLPIDVWVTGGAADMPEARCFEYKADGNLVIVPCKEDK